MMPAMTAAGIHVAGIDVGSRMTKSVLLDPEGRLVGRSIVPSGHNLGGAAATALAAARTAGGIDGALPVYIAATGYGRYQVDFRDLQITEVTCHARGAHELFPNTRSLLDMGAMNSRAILVGEKGRVRAFRMNDKCASGSGRFIERVARVLEIELEAVGATSLRSLQPCPISSVCAVLAESEVINQVTIGHPIEDILMGVHRSIADRLAALVRQVGVEEEVTLTGGVTLNAGMVVALGDRLSVQLNAAPEGMFAGALGAGLLARWRLERRAAESRASATSKTES